MSWREEFGDTVPSIYLLTPVLIIFSYNETDSPPFMEPNEPQTPNRLCPV